METPMAETIYRNRRAVQIENELIRVTVLVEGGHIAEIFHKPTGLNPLWTPPWPSIEPSAYRPDKHAEYGADSESVLLAGIMGHNLCLDMFGPPSEDEAAAGITVHGEASIVPYSIRVERNQLVASAQLILAHLNFERRLSLDGETIHITEVVQNCAATDRPIAWTQHVTLGPPFIVPGETQFEVPATRSKTFEGEFGDVFPSGVDFDWPFAPRRDGGTLDLRTYTSAPVSAGFTTHLMDPSREDAFFAAWSPSSKVLFGYRWKRADFPWLGIWEENHSRRGVPWNGNTLTRGMEFGVSPMPETRRKMIERGSLFGVPGYAWIGAGQSLSVHYSAFIRQSDGLQAFSSI
jgi:hypothetical protein